MKKKILVITLGIIIALVPLILTYPFHQEPAKNTIRILTEKPLHEKHFRILPLLNTGDYLFVSQGDDFLLQAKDEKKPSLHFKVIRDENTRALIFLKNEADVLFDTLSIAKTEWIRKKINPNQIRIISCPGESVSKLAMNSESRHLRHPDLRKKIEAALPVKNWSRSVFQDWVEPLIPTLETSSDAFTTSDSTPIELNYLTTPSREGQQIAYLTREALKKIGINVKIGIFEPALFFAKIRKREFDLYSSTSIPGMNNILDLPGTIQIPLFRWKHGLLIGSRVIVPNNIEASLDYSFHFLSQLQLQSFP